MKRLAAILLLVVHLFNLAGYSLLFSYLINRADSALVQRLDAANYADKDLIEVKVPLHMPYINDTRDFERVDGQLELRGVHYNYVKRKITGDTLYLLCLPDFYKTQLYNAKADYAKESNDIPTGKKSAEQVTKKGGLTNEYNTAIHQFIFSYTPAAIQQENIFIASKLSFVLLQFPAQPPDQV